MSWKKKLLLILALELIIFISAIAFSSMVGAAGVPPRESLSVLVYSIPYLGPYLVEPFWLPKIETIMLQIRLPRIIIASLVGAGLAVAGAGYQGLLRNPLADPYILGVSSGAALGATIVILFGGSNFLISFFAFLGAIIAVVLVYGIGSTGTKSTIETLILAGVIVGAFFNAILSFLLTRSYDNLEQVMFWLMGSVSLRGWNQIAFLAPVLILFIVLLWLFSRELNVLALGEETAGYLGISVESTKVLILIISSMLAALSVAMAGTVGFVGLVIPHIVRLLIGPDHRILIPVSAFTGAIFLVLADTLARIVIAPAELPLGVITAFFGAPFFAYLLRTKRYRF